MSELDSTKESAPPERLPVWQENPGPAAKVAIELVVLLFSDIG